MKEATVIIPNYNGMVYLDNCLASLRKQSTHNFSIIVIDNGSDDGSVEFIREAYPEVFLKCFPHNTGFCHAVNAGIELAETPYVILLNNDTVCGTDFVASLVKAMNRRSNCFSCSARMLRMHQRDVLDDAGDYYCALGWAFAAGKGKPEKQYHKERRIFASCAGAAIYRKEIFQEIGMFDERHFAYLEDIDIGYRANICGYRSWYIPEAEVLHAGSATSGSAYNAFKVDYSSRNSVYLIYKNMPLVQLILNLPFLLIGFLVKFLFFAGHGFGLRYLRGLCAGICYGKRQNKVPFQWKHMPNYLRIQIELWVNMVRRFCF